MHTCDMYVLSVVYVVCAVCTYDACALVCMCHACATCVACGVYVPHVHMWCAPMCDMFVLYCGPVVHICDVCYVRCAYVVCKHVLHACMWCVFVCTHVICMCCVRCVCVVCVLGVLCTHVWRVSVVCATWAWDGERRKAVCPRPAVLCLAWRAGRDRARALVLSG